MMQVAMNQVLVTCKNITYLIDLIFIDLIFNLILYYYFLLLFLLLSRAEGEATTDIAIRCRCKLGGRVKKRFQVSQQSAT